MLGGSEWRLPRFRSAPLCRIAAILAASLSLLVLSACAIGPEYGKMKAVVADVAPGQARLIFFREWHFVGSVISARIKIDGKNVGYVSNAAVMLIDHAPGEIRITVDTSMNPGECVVPLKIEAGKTYYIEIGTQSGGEYMFGAAGVLLGSLRADVHQYCGGGWCAALRDKDDAPSRIEKLTLQSPNSS